MLWQAYPVNEKIRINNFFSLFEYHYDNSYVFPGETHNFWECIFVKQGSICVSADERVYNLSEGEIIFHKPLELHKFHVTDVHGADLLIFSFSAEGALTSYMQNKVFELTSAQKYIIFSMLSYIKENLQNIDIGQNTRLEAQYLYPFEKLSAYSHMVTAYITQLLLSLSDSKNILEVSTAPDAVLFNKAINYMNNRICKQPSISEIAAYCNISPAGIKRIFDKYAGIGVHRYFLMLKFKAAAELLKCGNSVSDTAKKLGFSSQAYFSKSFKREMGINPSDFR